VSGNPMTCDFTTVESHGWLCAVYLVEPPHRHLLSLEQLIRVEIASRAGPERLTAQQAGDMVAIWAGVVGK